MMLRRLALAALLALSPTLALAQVNAPDFSTAAYVRNALAGNVIIGGNLTVGGAIIDNTNGISLNSPTGGLKGAGTINIAADYYKNGTVIPETVSSPLALSAGGVLSCPTCVLISGTAHGDSAYAILSTDRYVYTNAAFTAPRVWTLPAANSLAAGTTIWITDAQNTVTTTNTLTVSRAGADTINIGSTSLLITGAAGGITFTTDGVSNWGVPVQTVSTGGSGRVTLTNHGVLVGAGTNPVTQLAVGSNGQLLLGATGADPAFATMSQDCTITAAGVITCPKTNNVAFTAGATAAAGQLPGEPSNGNASAGNVGEFISSNVLVGSAVSLTTGVAANVTSISLTAGDWDVYGSVAFNPGGTTSYTAVAGWISTTTAAFPTAPNNGAEIVYTLAFTTGATQVFPVGRTRLSLSGTTTVFLSGSSTFSVSTMGIYGFIGARRAR